MALNNGFGIDFSGFLDFAEDISTMYGDEFLLYAAEHALEETRKYVNGEIAKIVYTGASKWSFFKGVAYSQGKAQESFEEVSQMPVEVNGTQVTAYAGFDLSKSPEIMFVIYGTPHMAADKKLYNAVKVKGRVKKEVARIQAKVFHTILSGRLIR